MQRNRDTYILISFMIYTAILMGISINNGHNWGDDFALYISQAKSIINFSIKDLYELNKYTNQNSTNNIGPYLYPQGFPLLLVPIYYLFGMNFLAMKIFCSFFLVFSIPLIYKQYRPYFQSSIYIYLIIIGVVFHKDFITFSDVILSDLPYFYFSTLSFTLFRKRNTILNQALLGLSIFISYLIRDIGVFLVPSLLVYQIMTLKRWKADNSNKAFLVFPYLIFCFGVFSTKIIFPNGGENHIAMILSNLSLDNAKDSTIYYIDLVMEYFLFKGISVIPIIGIILIGILSSHRQSLHFLTYCVFVSIILIFWPAHQGTRFIFPIIPFIIYYLLEGSLFISKKLTINYRYLSALLTILSALFIWVNLKNIINYSKIDTNQSYTPEMSSVYDYISNNVDKDQTIVFLKPRALRLFTDRNSIRINENKFAESNATYLLIHKAKYHNMLLKHKNIYETQNYVLLTKDIE